MNKLETLFQDKGLNYAEFARLMGKPSKNAEVSTWISTGKSLTELNTETVIDIARVLNMKIDDLLMDYEANGTFTALKNVKGYVDKTRETFGLEENGSFEVISNIGKRYVFQLTESITLAKANGVENPEREFLGNEPMLTNDQLLAETAKIDPAFKKRLDSYRDEGIKRKAPVVLRYDERDGVGEFTLAIFRETFESALVERVEAVQAEFPIDPNEGWLKTYAGIVCNDFSDFAKKIKSNPCTYEEFFELIGKITAAIGVNR